MNKINITNWKEFQVGSLFEIKKPPVLHTREVEESKDGINYVVRTKFNNGIKYKVSKLNNVEPTKKGVISFGSENSSFFYQEAEFYSGRDIYYIDTERLTKSSCLFLIACLTKILNKYSYSYGLFPELLSKEKIKLPIDSDSNPNWEYMEEYIKNIEKEQKEKLEQLKKNDLNKTLINTDNWKEFRVGDLFDIHPTKAYKLTNVKLLDDGETPVVVNSAYNNGIGGYSTLNPTEKGNMITFSDTVDANTIFYQENDFVGYPHVQGLYPTELYKTKWNKYTLMFFVSMFKATALAKSFDYGNKFRRDIAIDLIVKLPTKNEDPNWEYMEEYIKNIEKNRINELSKFKKFINNIV